MLSRPVGLTLSGLMLAWLAALLIVAWLVWTAHGVAIDRGRRATAAFSALARVDLGAWLEAARPLPEVLCDVGELDVAVVNLVANARDAMAGSGRLALRAFAEPPRFVCLLVQDEGRGMTDEVRRQALDPFFTTKGEAGTGLGLSQVYGFMRQLGGHIAIESAPGRGTVVRLSFPVAPPP